MKKHTVYFKLVFFVSLFFSILLVNCDQEPLFWDIAHEYPPISPDIGGSPTKIVSIGSTLYVSNVNNVWTYNTTTDPNNPFWEKLDGPDKIYFKARDLAVAGGVLFALERTETGRNSRTGTIWKWNGTGLGWASLTNYQNVVNAEKLFGAGNYLFVVERIGSLNAADAYKSAYTIRCLNTSGSEISNLPSTGLLMGAVEFSGTIYLGTLGNGLYPCTASGIISSTQDPNLDADAAIVGLAVHNSQMYICTERQIYCYGAPAALVAVGYHFSGALAGWTDGTNHLLLAGLRRSSGSFGFGYREIWLDSGTFRGPKIPGEGFEISPPNINRLSSVKIGSQYVSAVGKNAIYYFHVMPSTFIPHADDGDDLDGDGTFEAAPRPVIFACTANSGLWSYRTRNAKPQWNGEDNTRF